MNPLVFSSVYAQSRHDWNAGMIAATFATMMSSLWAKHPRKYSPNDLMYDPSQEARNARPKSAKDLYVMIRTALLVKAPVEYPANG